MEKELRKKIHKTRKRLIAHRGAVITQSIDVEAMVGSIIRLYFVKGEKHTEFTRKVMEESNFTFGLQINVLEKLDFGYSDSLIKDLKRIMQIRNIFAHCIPIGFDGRLAGYDRNKKDFEERELEEWYREFLVKVVKVHNELDEIFMKLVEKHKND